MARKPQLAEVVERASVDNQIPASATLVDDAIAGEMLAQVGRDTAAISGTDGQIVHLRDGKSVRVWRLASVRDAVHRARESDAHDALVRSPEYAQQQAEQAAEREYRMAVGAITDVSAIQQFNARAAALNEMLAAGAITREKRRERLLAIANEINGETRKRTQAAFDAQTESERKRLNAN